MRTLVFPNFLMQFQGFGKIPYGPEIIVAVSERTDLCVIHPARVDVTPRIDEDGRSKRMTPHRRDTSFQILLSKTKILMLQVIYDAL